jgi:hypothetical protein
MSTDLMLSQALAANRLVRFEPELYPDQGAYRDIYMTPALFSWLYQKDSKRGANFKANIRAQLKIFIVNSNEPKIDNDDYMKSWPNHVCSDVFEVRYQLRPDHPDATRIFGAFLEQDRLILFHQKLRAEIKNWDKPIQKTVDLWNSALPGAYMVRAHPFSNCVSGNFSDVYSS